MKKHAEDIIRELQVTEKGTALGASDNKYLMKVATWANKIEIKSAVEKRFNVTVTKVNTMRFAGKRKRDRSMRGIGSRPNWKRAVVTLKPRDSIETV